MTGSRPNLLQRMRLAQRPLRLATGQPRALRPVTAGRSAVRFAEALLVRYTAQVFAARPAGLAFLAVGPRTIVQHGMHRSQITLALRLALSVFDWQRTARQHAPAQHPAVEHVHVRQHASTRIVERNRPVLELAHVRPVASQPTLRLQFASLRTPPTLHAAARDPSTPEFSPAEIVREVRQQGRLALVAEQRTLHRLTERAERVPMIARDTAASPATHAPNPLNRASAVPRVLRRAAAPLSEDAHAPPSTPAPRGMPRTVGWHGEAGGTSQPAALDTFQIQRLADQVVQVIDSRVIARRERMGRM